MKRLTVRPSISRFSQTFTSCNCREAKPVLGELSTGFVIDCRVLQRRRWPTPAQAVGVMIPTRRCVLAYDEGRHKVPEPVLVSIDLSEIQLT
jgi:hypothetical protein